MKLSKPEYLAKAQQLSVDEQERLLSRMVGKLPKRLQKDKLSREEALAIQLELEDEQLQEWRERMHALKAEAKAKEKQVKEKTEKPEKPEKAPDQKSAKTPAETKPAAEKPAAKKPAPKKPATKKPAA